MRSRGKTSVGFEPMEAPMLRQSIKSAPTADDDFALRWWTYGLLIFYVASLLVFCGLVAIQEYYPAEGLRGVSASANPSHLPIAPFKIAKLGITGPSPRTVCYEVLD
jgi:hypothetical protein